MTSPIRSMVLKDVVLALTLEGCKGRDSAELVRVGFEVKRAIAEYRTVHGERQIPDPGCPSIEESVGYSDFEIARRLDFVPLLAKVQAKAQQIDAMLAYILIALTSKDVYFPEEIALDFLVHSRLVESRQVMQEIARLQPIAAHGEVSLKNRKQGRLKPVNAMVKGYLSKNPEASAEMVWNALKAKPPRGHSFCDNRIGRYIEKDAKTIMEWPRFKNVVSEHRPKRTKA